MKILYWVVTGLLALMLAASGFVHLTHQPFAVGPMKTLGYPEYMMTILGTAKLLAAITLLIPGFPRLKEWAYAGCTFLLIGAAWSHLANGQGPGGPLFVLALVAVSYWLRLRRTAAPIAA